MTGTGGNHLALVGLGSNLGGPLGSPQDYVELALDRLATTRGISSLRHSRLYSSAPWGNTSQGDFINAVAAVEAQLGASELLEELLGLENELGRQRAEKWGPRIIDLDLLCFDDVQTTTDRLVLPHPHMHERAFVLVPLLELEPGFRIPGKELARDFLARLDDADTVQPL